jgi:hypothetical protein
LRVPKTSSGLVTATLITELGAPGAAVPFRLDYLGVTNALALLRLLSMSERDKDAGILALRPQIALLQRQLDSEKTRMNWADRAWLAALPHRLPRDVLRKVQLLVRPETVLRRHRDLIADRHARSALAVSASNVDAMAKRQS